VVSVSSAELRHMSSSGNFDNETKDVLEHSAAREDGIKKRGEAVEKAIKAALGEDAKISVDVWHPW
jgi:hypothetical protein